MMRRLSTLFAVLLVWLSAVANAVELRESGQSVCYNTAGAVISCAGTGQDGEFTPGAAWPTTRFTVTGDQTVSDAMTDLVWPVAGNTPGPAACGPGIVKNWLGAFNYVNCLNSNSYLGYSDWRLPGIRELRSLINYGSAKQSTWLNAAGFTSIQDSDYWSSTTYSGSPTSGWTVSMGQGGVTNIVHKSGTARVLPVRKGLDAASLLPLSHSFGSLTTDTASNPQEFTIINGGGSSLTVSSIATTGPDASHFEVASGGSKPCGSLTPTIPVDGSCSVVVIFAPTSTGPKEAALSITTNSVSHPSMSSPVTGISRAATANVSSDSGQTTCYDTAGALISCAGTGQNGELTPGAAWPATRFTVNGDQTVSDDMTDLVWPVTGNTPGPAACSPGIAKSWLEAFNYVNCLNSNSYLGYSDWRLPGIRELRSLINYGSVKQSTWLNAAGFTSIQDSDYWSSTTYSGDTTRSWTVSMGKGGVTNMVHKSGTARVLPVRKGLDAAALMPLSHSFGSLTTDTTSNPQEFTIINGGANSLTVSSINLAGADAGHFKVASGGSNPCVSLTPTIPVNGSCSVVVIFAPTSTGPKEAALSLTTSSVSHPGMSSPVTGISRAASTYVSSDSGQTTCYDTAGAVISCAGTGQNGEFTPGATWPATRFTLNGDQTVGDAMTDLVWPVAGNTPGPAACGPGVAKNWLGAFNYVNCLNSNSHLGYSDWRLPGIRELRSLINYGSAKQSTWLNAAGFTSIQDSDYWSSTTYSGDTTRSWTVSMGKGGVTNIVHKSGTARVLPVRKGLDAAALMPLSHSFGSLTTDTTSNPQEFTIINGGANSLSVSSIEITGSDAAHFMVASGGSNPCGSLTPTIPVNGSCSVVVIFAPTTTGPKEAALSITTNSVSHPGMNSPVTGISRAATTNVSSDSGQTTCYDTAGALISCAGTGQNGELTPGAAWPGTRFTVNGDQTVSDAMTDLVWPVAGNTPGPAACGTGIVKNWLGAFNYVNCLNSNSYLGYSDWRLPGIRELRSLINYGSAKQSTWLNAAGFSSIQDSDYWSSTTYSGSTSSAWTVSMGQGGVTNIVHKSGTARVLPVRKGLDAASLLPLSHSFGSLTIDTTSNPQEFTIINGGASSLTVSSIDLIGADAAHFKVASGGSNPCGSLTPTIPVNGSCSVIVIFAPTTTGPKEAVLSITTSSVSHPSMSSQVTGISTMATTVGSNDSGQTTCYDMAGAVISCAGTGQDGESTPGVPWPATRFTVSDGHTVSDAMTDLVWPVAGNTPGPAACGPGLGKSWVEAINFVNCLNSNSYLGYDDWRLPGIRELRSLINYGSAKQSTWLNGAGFTSIQDSDYWSSTTYSGGATSAWTVSMGKGGVTNIVSKSGSARVLPVRQGRSRIFVTKSGTGVGEITSDTGSLTWTGKTGFKDFLYGTTVTLTSVPEAGSSTTSWEGCDSISGDLCFINLKMSRVIAATLSDTAAPAINEFALNSPERSATVPVTISAQDNLGITEWCLNESDDATSCSWTATQPGSYTFTRLVQGIPAARTLYLFAKDAASNISASVSSTTTITLPDTTLPVISAFTAPSSALSGVQMAISITASDNLAVTGYYLSLSSATPSPTAPGWSSVPPNSYTVSTAGTKAIYAFAKDAAGNVSAYRYVIVSVANPPLPTLSGTTATTATVGAAYSFTPTSTYAASFSSTGTLPPGITFDSSTGTLGGTPTTVGTYSNIVITALNATGSASLPAFTITVNPPVPTISGTPATKSTIGTAYSFTPTATYTASFSSTGTLPPGISLNTSTGALTGTPTTVGTYSDIVITAVNVTGSASLPAFTITVNPPAPTISGTPSTSATVGTAYSFTPAAIHAASFSSTGTLPPGMTLDSSTGALAGTPTTVGTYSDIVITATNVTGSASLPAFTITVNPPAPTISGTPATTSIIGTTYSFTPTATHAASFSFTGALPPGMSLDTSTGALAGTPTAVGSYSNIVITATNVTGSASLPAFTITVNPPAPTISGTPATTSIIGTTYSFTPTATHAASFSSTGTLPPGISLNTSTGALEGTPTTVGTYSDIAITAINVTGSASLPAFSITVTPPAPTIAGTPATTASVGIAYSFTPTATGAASFSYTGILPPGLRLDSSTGALTGTPSTPGTFSNIVIIAINDAGRVSLPAFTITVALPETLSVAVTGTGGGAVNSSPGAITCMNGSTSGCSGSFAGGISVILMATPDSNSTFGGWGGDCQGTDACSVSMTSDRSVVATFNAVPKVRIGNALYDDLFAACTAASNGTTIMARGVEFGENLIFTGSNVTLKGGYDLTFSTNNGSYTTINGSLKIRAGRLTVDKVKVR